MTTTVRGDKSVNDLRLPFERLEHLIRLRMEWPRPRSGTDEFVTRNLAVVIGCHCRQVQRWRRDGLSVNQADTLAMRVLGLHPSCVWDEWRDVVERDLAAEIAEQGRLPGVA